MTLERTKTVSWPTIIFFVLTTGFALVGTPLFLRSFGEQVGWFDWAVAGFMYLAGMVSLTGGYHRLFSHRAYEASWPVRLVALLFAAGTFQYSALWWASEHRHHHKNADTEGDPYNINRGFLWAHIGWLITPLVPENPHDNVDDLHKDPLVRWQHRHVRWLNFAMGLGLPMAMTTIYSVVVGRPLWIGLVSGFLIGGNVAITAIEHSVFFINSLCHTIGSRPYDTNQTARDSFIMAVLTLGEGYHNYHHKFQHDYRNGFRPWHFDPNKWIIYTLSKVGLTSDLKRVPEESIILAQLAEKRRHLELNAKSGKVTLCDRVQALMGEMHDTVVEKHKAFRILASQYASMQKVGGKPEGQQELKQRLEATRAELRHLINNWNRTHRTVLSGA